LTHFEKSRWGMTLVANARILNLEFLVRIFYYYFVSPYLGKFKSGLQAGNSLGITANEMMELLKTRDHNGEYRSVSDQGGTTFSS